MSAHILYLVHDVSDAGVEKRVRMMTAGGANVSIMGFRRCDEIIADVAGFPVIDLGRTYNAGFGQRIKAVMNVMKGIGQYRAQFEAADIVMARNLEMLAIADKGRKFRSEGAQRFIYELLDVHRFLFAGGLVGFCFRALEGWFGRALDLVVTSSPAFGREYLEKKSKVKAPHILVENKVFMPGKVEDRAQIAVQAPWVIGWFGILRCRASFEILRTLSRREDVQVVMRGKPAIDEIPDFHEVVAAEEGMDFRGAYTNPDDLARIYGSVHFTWAIDMYEAGLNSSWLLPNRIYEGGLYSAVPIAQRTLETGRYLQRLGVGVLLEGDVAVDLAEFFDGFDAGEYEALKMASRVISRTHWAHEQDDCDALVEAIKG